MIPVGAHEQQRRHGWAAMGQDDVRRERDQFGCVFAHGCGIAGAPAMETDKSRRRDGTAGLPPTADTFGHCRDGR
jgi:hypothetical protein